MSMEDVLELSPHATRAECKLLQRIIRDKRATQIYLQNLSTENEGLLRQLNTLFPGKFRAAVGAPLYMHDDTTVVQSTHKVSSVPWRGGV